jgi:hypothetical protein
MTKRSHTLVITLVIASAIVLLPSTARLQEKTETPASAPTETPASAQTETPASAPQENNIYIIIKGDTLWDISDSALKDPFLWPLIWKENPFITNPDLIYPGDRLTIPSLAPIERAMQAPADAAPAPEAQGEKADAAATPEAAAPAETGSKPPTVAAPVQEETPAKRKLILEQETVHPLIDKYTMLSAGYVSTDQWGESITGTLEPKAMFGFDDIVFIKVNAPENVKIGDKYLVFAPVKKVKHPRTRKKLGRLIKILGILQVIEKAPGAAYLTARISLSFDSMAKGNLLAPYQEPMLIYAVPKNDGRDINGRIIEVMDSRSINGNFDMLYLDKGSSDGVKPGDRFIVFLDPLKKGFPRKIIGEAMVVLVKDTTATALVKNSTDPITKGDKVELVK